MTDTASAAPSADEILTLWHRQPIQVNQSADAFVVAFAREALAKWGQPTHSEPVVCGCGDEYPPQGYDAGFIAAIGRCANCQAALDCAQPQAEPKSCAKSFQTYGEVNAYSKGYYAGKKAATQAQAGAVLTDREIELIDGMIQIHLDHASRCDAIANRAMADKQKGWDMERVALLQKLKANGIKGGQHGN